MNDLLTFLLVVIFVGSFSAMLELGRRALRLESDVLYELDDAVWIDEEWHRRHRRYVSMRRFVRRVWLAIGVLCCAGISAGTAFVFAARLISPPGAISFSRVEGLPANGEVTPAGTTTSDGETPVQFLRLESAEPRVARYAGTLVGVTTDGRTIVIEESRRGTDLDTRPRRTSVGLVPETRIESFERSGAGRRLGFGTLTTADLHVGDQVEVTAEQHQDRLVARAIAVARP